MPRKARRSTSSQRPGTVRGRTRRARIQETTQRSSVGVRAARDRAHRETTAIVLRIAADRAVEFERLFEAEEAPIWDDFTRRGRFLEAQLVRATGGSEQRDGIQDYILHVITADHDAHEEHDSDPRFRAFLTKARQLQPEEPLVWYGDVLVERRG